MKYSERLYKTLEIFTKGGNAVNDLYPTGEVSESLRFLEEDIKQLSADQAVAINRILFSKDNFITVCGKAGSGKTHLIKQVLVPILNTCFQCNLVVTSFTGLANQNCGGDGTLSSIFGTGIKEALPWDYRDCTIEEFNPKIHRVSSKQVSSTIPIHSPLKNLNENQPLIMVIDEFSMVSSEKLHSFYHTCLYLMKAWNGSNSGKVTGQAQKVRFILFGDSMQLLPIGLGEDLNKSSRKSKSYTKYKSDSYTNLNLVDLAWDPARWVTQDGTKIKESPLVSMGNQKPDYNKVPNFSHISLALLENHRQNEDKIFADALNYIRVGGKIGEGPAQVLLNRIVGKRLEAPTHNECIHLYLANKDVIEHNRMVVDSMPDNHKATFYPYIYVPKSISGYVVKQEKNRLYLKDHKSTSKLWIPDWVGDNVVQELAIGLPFMIRQNFPSRQLFNGTVGIIKEFIENTGASKSVNKYSGIKIELEDGRLEVIEPEECVGVKNYPTSKGTSSPNYTTKPTYRALPGHICVALTCHKSQGLSVNKPLIVHFKQKHKSIVPEHWAYVALSRPTKMSYLYLDGDLETINSHIKISASASDFTKQAEMVMQDECSGEVFVDSISPEDIKNMIPCLQDVRYSESDNTYTFFFILYIQNTTVEFVAYYNCDSDWLVYKDIETEELFSPEDFKFHSQSFDKIQRYLVSKNKDVFDAKLEDTTEE